MHRFFIKSEYAVLSNMIKQFCYEKYPGAYVSGIHPQR